MEVRLIYIQTGVKILGDEGVTDSTEASALNHELNGVDIYTNSWGPSDGYGHIGPGSVTESALYDGVTKVFPYSYHVEQPGPFRKGQRYSGCTASTMAIYLMYMY